MIRVVAFVLVSVHLALGMYSSSDDVVVLTPSNFNKEVVQSDDLWIIEFYAPWCGHCKQLTPEWKKAATALKGVVKVGAVDADAHGQLGSQYGVRGFPTLKVFGANKNSPSDYSGGRTAQAIVDGAMSSLKSLVQERLRGGGRSSGGGSGGGQKQQKQGNPDDVITLTDANFEELVLKSDDMWMVEFFAPWCGHCKTLAPHWASAATELKGKVKLGALDATEHRAIAGRYGVQGFPTLKMFPSGKKEHLGAGEAVEYDGGRTAADIVAWANEKLAENIPPPAPKEITEQSVLDDACNDKALCIVAVLPHILDCQADCRNKYIEVMKTQGEKFKKNMWGWLWAEAGQQNPLEEAMGIGGFGYPAMAAVNTRKGKYALLRGSFGDTGIYEFLRDLSYGKGSTATLKNAKLPDVKKRAPWDGKDGKPIEEEEWDLSDVDLEPLDDVKKTEL